MVWVPMLLAMAINIKVSGRMVNRMDKAPFPLPMEVNIKESGLMASNMG